ncbi:BRCT domain-containing protein [Mycena kentingensis (nom. inval.)]|nr:BRCT domain-containing protein [Mycena kentingensis (nom. inval.)]
MNQEELPSHETLNKFLLSTLKEADNPICHSDIAERSAPMFSTSTGHQVAEGIVNRRLYLTERSKKIKVQLAADLDVVAPMVADAAVQPQVLAAAKCYINGYLEGTTDLEMKRIITSAGGTVLPVASSQVTHIITSQPLSGSKTHKILAAKSKRVPHVVKPEWVFASIQAGKRQPERTYAIIQNAGQRSIC